MIISSIRDFLRLETASSILLVCATVLAMIAANSPAKPLYDALLHTPVEIRIGDFGILKPLLLWVNDGLMAIFFFLIGLEVKRESMRGELSDPARVALPIVAAIGGMAVPALIYIFINWGDEAAIKGWAIPTATDIAFALGVLAMLGKRVPNALKLFLLALAIADDLGAIVIIALFYTADLSLISLLIAAVAIFCLFVLNRSGVLSIIPYLLLGTVLWVAVLKSGVHATLAGVAIAMFIPLQVPDENEQSPLEKLEHDLHPSVAFLILPLFAFTNTGVSLEGVSVSSLLNPIPLGITLGLLLGKQIGVLLFSWLVVKFGFARLPEGTKWIHMYGVSLLCGIGFTMSLFISSLAFSQGGADISVDDRLGILCGSVLSALAGYAVLHYSLKK
jgi:Na+:H+ antiporter, NhaA family